MANRHANNEFKKEAISFPVTQYQVFIQDYNSSAAIHANDLYLPNLEIEL